MNDQLISENALIKLKRIYRLSHKPPNPGFAYRHLEHIHALCESLLTEMTKESELGPELRPLMATLGDIVPETA